MLGNRSFRSAFDLFKCLTQIKNGDCSLHAAPISELPSKISAMIKRQDVQFDNEELIKNVKHNIKTETKKFILKTKIYEKK